jgi:hypothetical protein
VIWNDESSYSRGESPRIPKTWVTHAAGLKICVTRHRDYHPGAWILRCDPFEPMRELTSENIDDAKQEARKIIARYLSAALTQVQV